MLQFTCLPKPVTSWLRVLRPIFHHRHHLVFCWLLVCQGIYQEKATIQGLARLAPRHIAESSDERPILTIARKTHSFAGCWSDFIAHRGPKWSSS
jgi:hypothetical protein